jgi:hypothetical protein
MKQFTMSNCKYGAPMGRASYGTPETPAKLFKVNLDSGGYDDGSAYWGHGGGYLYCLETSPVWQEDIKMDTEESRHFYRAYSRHEAFQCNEMSATSKVKWQEGKIDAWLTCYTFNVERVQTGFSLIEVIEQEGGVSCQ